MRSESAVVTVDETVATIVRSVVGLGGDVYTHQWVE
jgi:hypothetical protein